MKNDWLGQAARRRVSTYLDGLFAHLFRNCQLDFGLPQQVRDAAKVHPDFQDGWVCWATLRTQQFHVGSIDDYVREIMP